MRPVSDFFSGIASGLGGTKARSCPKRGKRATPAAPRSVFVEVVGRFCLLLAAVGVGAAALVASAGGPLRTRQPSEPAPLPGETIVPGEVPPEVTEFDSGVPARDWKYIVLHHS